MLVVIGNTDQFLVQVLFAHVSSVLHFSEPAFLMLMAVGWTFKQFFCKKRDSLLVLPTEVEQVCATFPETSLNTPPSVGYSHLNSFCLTYNGAY